MGLFGDLFDKMTAIEVKGIPIIYNILGQVSAFGTWDLLALSCVLFIAVLIIALLKTKKGYEKGAYVSKKLDNKYRFSPQI